MTIAAAVHEPATAGPYKFLDFYEEQDKVKFAGRERDIREVVARICANRTFVLYAPSGLGKTSLLLAGVFPELRQRRFTPVYVRTLEDPLQDLCAAVARELETGPIRNFDELAAILEAHSPRTTVVLVLDQFEEFFIHFRSQAAQRAAFVSSVATLAGMSSLNVRVVFSLREDYLAELDEFRDEVTDLFAHDYRLRRLSAFGARQAIAQPLIVAGIQHDRRLLVRLVDLLADVGFDPVMLQILCAEVYRMSSARAGAGAQMTESDLDRAGGLDGVVRRYLDRVIAAIPEGSVLLSRTVLDAMLTQEKTKRAVTFEALVSADFSASREELERILGIFVTHRLLRSEQRGQHVWYELSHERLVEPVLDWLKLDRDFFNFRVARDLVANSCSGEVWRSNVETLLAEGALIHVIGPYARRLRFTPTELDFIYRSAVYRKTDTAYWATLVGAEKCTGILLEYLQTDSVAARCAAAHAAASSPDPTSMLGDACMHLAMTDPEPSVRRTAGRALATLATDAHLGAIALALKRRKTRPAALEVIADLREMRRPLRRFGVVSRLRARYIADRRVRRQHAENIRDRGKQGALIGLLTTMAWSGSVAFPAAVVLGWVTGEPIELGVVASGGTTMVLLAMGIGTFLGWRLGRAAALDAAHHGEGRWSHAVMRLRVMYLPLLLLPIWALLLEDTVAAAGYILASGLTVQVIVGLVAKIARPAVWPRVAPRGIWGWSLAASAGLPLLLAGLAVWALAASGDEGEMQVVAAFYGIGISLAAAVAVNTLSRAPVSSATPAVPPSLRQGARIRLGLLLASVFVWLALTYGLDSLPIAASSIPVDGEQPVEFSASLRPRLADSAYFQLANRGPDARWLRVTGVPASAGAFFDGDQLTLTSLLLIPAGGHRMVIRGQVDTDAPQALRLEQMPVVSGDDVVLQDEAVVVARFTPSADRSVWTTTIKGTISATRPYASRVTVSVVGSYPVQSADVRIDPAGGTRAVEGESGTAGVLLADSAAVTLSNATPIVVLPIGPDRAWSVQLQLRAVEPFRLEGRNRIDRPISLRPSAQP